MKKKLLSILLSLAMVITMMPMATSVAFAGTGTEDPDYLNQPFAIKALEDGTVVSLVKYQNPEDIRLQYSTTTDPSDWKDYTLGEGIPVNLGTSIFFKASGTNKTFSISTNNYYYFSTAGKTVNVSGNIMSLLDGENFASMTSLATNSDSPEGTNYSYCFYGLLRNESDKINIGSAKNLILPATELSKGCYYRMFVNCTSLKEAPELPATTLAESCYCQMFDGCTLLENAPELPATTLVKTCYDAMFRNCTSLKEAPELPATTLKNNCYYRMFSGCKSLKEAPELPAPLLEYECYSEMFIDCIALKTIKVGFSTWPTNGNKLKDWVKGVPEGGTFICPEELPHVSPTNCGVSKIPTGWNVVTITNWEVIPSEQSTGTKYYSFPTELQKGDTIKLLEDVNQTTQIVLPSGTDITLDLNGHVLDRGLSNSSAAENGNVITVEQGAKLTITDKSGTSTGKITGGNALYGGAIISKGDTILEGGTISGCKAVSSDYDRSGSQKGRGGAIYVPYTGSFTMTGGKIENCSASVAGGAVFVVGKMEMTAGTITNCSVSGVDDAGTVKAKGGAVYLYGDSNFTMTGGEISGNKLGNVEDMRGAGVYAASDANVTLGGTAKITGNMNGDNKASNLFLCDGVKFVISTNMAPKTGMNVGVTTKTAPTEGTPVRFTTNGTASDKQYFFSDSTDYYVNFNKDHLELKTCAAKIGDKTYATLADALAVAKDNDTLKLLANNSETITVNKAITFHVNANGKEFTPNNITAGEGYKLESVGQEDTTTYTVSKKGNTDTYKKIFIAAGITAATIATVKTVDVLVKEAKAEKSAKLLEEAKTAAQQALTEAVGNSTSKTVKKYFNEGTEAVANATTPDEVMNATVKYVSLIGGVILVKDTKIHQNKLTASKNGKIKVSFENPELDGTVDYQVVRSTKKDFSKSKKTYTVKVKDQKTLTLTNAKSLKKGTKYYYKVRAKVELSDGTTVYTKWSNIRYTKCKKTRK